jgi:CspA family cold shock protein
MVTGTVKWFNPAKGFGFIEPEDGSKDAFVHISAVESSGLSSLNEGQKVQFDLVPGREGKMAAENLVDLSSGEGAAVVAPAAEEESGGDDAAGESADTDDVGDDTDDDAAGESGEDAEVNE